MAFKIKKFLMLTKRQIAFNLLSKLKLSAIKEISNHTFNANYTMNSKRLDLISMLSLTIANQPIGNLYYLFLKTFNKECIL